MLPRHVYVHVPFCGRRCSYCDFSIAVRSRVPAADFAGALARELDLRAGSLVTSESWTIDTLYLGGGTPSRLGADGVIRVIDAIRCRSHLAAGAEVTIEANPDDVTPAAVRAWLEGGVNRVSLGVQSFDDGTLAWMRRTHDAATADRAIAVLRDAGVENWSLDLIFAVPVQLSRQWSRDLDRALAHTPPHLSLYGLTVESGTPIARWRERGQTVEAPEETYETEYLEAHRALTGAGYEHYEVSNFARMGARSRHNSSYWTGAPYLGLGPSAHGFDGAVRRWNVAAYEAWRRAVWAGRDPVAGQESLTRENLVAERVYLGLRTDCGLGLWPHETDVVAPWIAAGWGAVDDGLLRLTAEGWLRLDSLAASLTRLRSLSYT